MRSRFVPSVVLLLAIGLPLAVLIGCGGKSPQTEVDAQGATFVEPIMKFWTNEFLEKTGGKVKINYQGTGSGAGITQMTKKLAAFGCSDAPMTKKQLAEVPEGQAVVHIPLVIGAVVPVYNLPGVDQPIKFTGPLLAEIFTGKVKKWNDPKLKELNPGVGLPDLDIQPVYRSDPSGTSFIFTGYLSKVDQGFKKDVGWSNNPNWPKGTGIAQPKSDGVAGHISRSAGAIGYIELTYALDSKDKLKYGSVRNKAGKDVLADLESITAAADASIGEKQTQEPYSLHDLTYDLTDAGGEKSYPIAGMSFAVLYKRQEGAKGKTVVDFLRWVTSPEGQELAKKRNYAPLPASLGEKIGPRLDEVEVQ
ncbi:MAG: Phosphate-binding protein [Gemmataceae bacterium]|nr:Phosphate-binding protein [Gemmataceae bacterium]